jgi:peroxiredoxin
VNGWETSNKRRAIFRKVGWDLMVQQSTFWRTILTLGLVVGVAHRPQTSQVCAAPTEAKAVADLQAAAIAGESLIAADVWQLQDPRGRQWSWADFEKSDFVVVAFVGSECPLARLYAQRLRELAQVHAARSIAFVGVNSNLQDSLEEIERNAKELGLPFPVLKDPGHRLADALGATRTPEVFVLDRQRQVRYRGRIDDQYGIGYARQKPTRADLAIALQSLLAGEAVAEPHTEAVGCLIGRQRPVDNSANVTYSEHIAPILNQHCVQCHRSGQVGPMALTDYREVAGWAETIGEVVKDGRMPPWHATESHVPLANDRRLSDEHKRQLAAWVAAGAPAGDPARTPPLPHLVDGWRLPRHPDLVIPMADQPTVVPADGEIKYRYFVADPGLTEDRWVQAMEVLPGNRSIVHHVLIFLTQGDEDDVVEREFAGGARGFFAGYAPGSGADAYPEGMAKFLPAGSKLVFQIHYTPNGTEQSDLSQLGLVFADPATVRNEVETRSAFQPFLQIAPRGDDQQATTRTVLQDPERLLGLMPHLHLRGKSFRYLMKRPGDADWLTLLDVPRYDFNWQTSYRLADDLELPAGTAIRCIAHFDNSAANPNNPDPDARVRWGEQTQDEMLIGYFDVAHPVDPQHRSSTLRDVGLMRAEEFIGQCDRNEDFQLQLTEVPGRMREQGQEADRDRDGILTTTELQPLFSP